MYGENDGLGNGNRLHTARTQTYNAYKNNDLQVGLRMVYGLHYMDNTGIVD